jgi:hypothetical protein
MTPEFIRKYHIYKLISNHKSNSYISKRDIIDKLNSLYEINFENPLYVGLTKLSEKTIFRDVKDIQSFFGVEIKHLRNAGYILVDENLQNDSYQKIFDKMELFLTSHKEKEWSPYVTAEKSSLNISINVFELIRAIEKKKHIVITYKGWYDDHKFSELIDEKVQPLHIKESNRAWYLIIYNVKIGIKTICLDDRVESIKVLNQQVETPFEFNIKEYFKDSFGMLNDNSKPERIVLKVANHHFKHLMNRRLHLSQEIISYPKKLDTHNLNYLDDDIWGEIEVFLQPNYEFIMEILKFNLWVKVLEPKSFADKITERYQFVLDNYYQRDSFDKTIILDS